MKFYTVAGLTVASEIALPGLIPTIPTAEPAEIRIHLGEVPTDLPGAAQFGITWQANDDQFLLQIPGIARFLVTSGTQIAVAAEVGIPNDEIAIFLAGTVFGIVLHQRAQIVLHASAVLVGGKAVLFCGPSGAGKSTLAAALNQHGYPVISDDVSAIGLTPANLPQVLPDGRNLKLWKQAIERLGLERGQAVRQALEKYYVEPGSVLSEAAPIGAIYELIEARAPQLPGIAQPNIVDGALIVRRNAYRSLLVRRMGQQGRYFEASSRIANSAGIYTLTRSLDFSQMDEVIGWLKTHWTGQGFGTEAA